MCLQSSWSPDGLARLGDPLPTWVTRTAVGSRPQLRATGTLHRAAWASSRCGGWSPRARHPSRVEAAVCLRPGLGVLCGRVCRTARALLRGEEGPPGLAAISGLAASVELGECY